LRQQKAGPEVRPSLWSNRLQRALPEPDAGQAMEAARRALAGGDLTTAEQTCRQILSATRSEERRVGKEC
jgi:hypothetical protein